MRINCPLCGPRPNGEFTIKGDASNVRPEFVLAPSQDADIEKSKNTTQNKEWHDFVYLRDNPKGVLSEYWHHAHGCRSWLVVKRNNVSHEILSVQLACDHKNRETDI